jgi:hypothetical protein
MKGKKMKVIRVTRKEFELEDGQIFQHPVELDYTPAIAEFQKYYDDWYKILNEKIDNAR